MRHTSHVPPREKVRRYPGAGSFTDSDHDRRLFFGRDHESEELFHRILSEQLVVLFGKSGYGKTSLLQAGVFPRLRERELLPLPVRLNRRADNVLELFFGDIEQACRSAGIEHEPGARTSLWEYFKTTLFWRGEMLQTPVLVLDQFEEIFTLQGSDARQRIAHELGQLLHRGLPPEVQARQRAGEKLPYSDKPPEMKIVISLREDYMAALEELASEIPQILSERFRIAALDRANARSAVIEPASLFDPAFATRPFTYGEAAVTGMIDFLAGQSREIEPFQLQLLCSEVEREVAEQQALGQERVCVDERYLGGRAGMQAVIDHFYLDALSGLASGRDRRAARRLCEMGLVSPEGRRLSLEQDQLQRTHRVRPEVLARLIDARLLRKEPRLDSFYYELSHDSLTAPVMRDRVWRVRRRFVASVAAVLAIVFATGVPSIWAVLERAQAAEAQGQIDKAKADAADARETDARNRALALERSREGAEQRAREAQEGAEREARLRDEADRNASEARRAATRARQARVEAERLVAFMTEDLSSKLELLGKLPLLAELQGQVDRYHAKAGRADISPKVLATAHLNRGKILKAQGAIIEAHEAFEKSLEVRRALARRAPRDLERQYALAEAYHYLGESYEERSDLAGAQQAYERGHKLLDRLVIEQPESKWRALLGETISHLAMIRARRGSLQDARSLLDRAQAIFDDLAAQQHAEAAWRYQLADVYIGQGRVMRQGGDAGAARQAIERSQEILDTLTNEQPFNTTWQHLRLVSYNEMATAWETSGNRDKARDALIAGMKIAQELTRGDPSNRAWKRELAVHGGYVGWTHLDGHEMEKARQVLQQSLEIMQELTALSPEHLGWRSDLADCHWSIGNWHFRQKPRNSEDAEAEFQQSRAILEELRARDPDNEDVQRSLALTNSFLGALRMDEARYLDARSFFDESLRIRQRLVERNPDDMYLKEALAESHQELSQLFWWQGATFARTEDFVQALDALSTALRIREELVNLDLENRIWKARLAGAYFQAAGWLREIARGFSEANQKQKALEVFAEAIDKLETIVEYAPSQRDWRRLLAATYEDTANLAREMGELERARALYEKALGTLSELRDQGALDEEDEARGRRIRALLRSLPSR
jgi:tetratricopeptide (TPR) repeat protein